MAAGRRPGGGGGLPPCGFLVTATSGGQVPIGIEKRAKGKKVTVVAGVQGNARALCTALTTLLGVGGTTHERGAKATDVEVQGEQVERVTAALLQLGCVRGLPRTRETAAHVAERDCAYDALLAAPRERKPRHAASTAVSAGETLCEPPADAPCRRWHGHWPYCRGVCQRLAAGDSCLGDVFDLRSDAVSTQAARAPWAASRSMGIDALEAALRSLGMLSDMGDAVRAWVAEQQLRTEEQLRRRSAPQPSLCAAVPSRAATSGQFTCEECGAVFSLQKTLKKHLQLHRSERGELPPSVLRRHAAATAAVAAAAPAWRTSTREEAAAWEAAAEDEAAAWGAAAAAAAAAASPSDSDDEESAYAAPTSAASLGSWLSVAVDRRAPRRQRGGPGGIGSAKIASGTNGSSVECPVCGGRFPAASIEAHVDACLASAEVREYERATGSTNDPREASPLPQPESNETFEELSQDLLESLLDLELSATDAARFWQRYESASAALPRKSAQDAFLEALEATIAARYFEEDEDEEDENEDEDADEVDVSGVDVVAAVPSPTPAVSSTPSAAVGRRWGNRANAGSTSGKDDGGAAAVGSGGYAACEDVVAAPAAAKPAAAKAPAAGSAAAAVGAKEQPLEVWLRQALLPLVGESAADAIYAGLEVVLACDGDGDSAENAAELLAAELPSDSACNDAVLKEFRRRLGLPAPS